MLNRIPEIYNYIKKYKNYDSDFWSSGHGNLEILAMLLDFTDGSWEALENEIENWSSNEKEILANALCDDESWYYEKSIEINLSQRSQMFATIFATIETNLAFDLIDDFEFIFKGKSKGKILLEKVKSQIEDMKIHPANGYDSKERLEKMAELLNKEIKACS